MRICGYEALASKVIILLKYLRKHHFEDGYRAYV